VSKKYHIAKTPYQRITLSEAISSEIKNELEAEYLKLAPVFLMDELKRLLQELMQFAWQINGKQRNIAFDRVSEPDKKNCQKRQYLKSLIILGTKNLKTNGAFQGLIESEKTRSRKYGLKFN